MKVKYFAFLLMSSLAIMFSSCNGCSGGDKKKDDSIVIIPVDTLAQINEVEGTIGDGTSMNVLELITDAGDTIQISTPDNLIMGGATVGDRISVIYCSNKDENLASVAVNLTSLQHLWTQKASDGHEQSLELDQNGVAVTYDMGVDYCSWELKQGLLLLHTPKQVAKEKSEIVDTFQIMDLTDDHLVLSSLNGKIQTVFELDN